MVGGTSAKTTTYAYKAGNHRGAGRSMRIPLTPGQAITIHGLFRAREWLTWGDVLADEPLTFAKLQSYNVSEQSLYVLQPDLQAWVKTKKACLHDCPRMRAWDAHPIRDFKADLADLIATRWTHDTMTRVGVAYDELVELGLTPETMGLFSFTLMMWHEIGFRRVHADPIPPNTLYRLFGMAKQDILACLR